MAPILDDSELLARLVGHDSTSARSNLPIADFVCSYLDRPGVVLERRVDEGGTKANVVARIGPEPDERREGLVLSGHLDVVPADEPDWQGDARRLREADGRWYGRGTCDMKGFVALASNVLATRAAEDLDRPLVLVLTADEELGSLGARRLAETWPADRPLPRAAVIGEPTSLRVVRMHKGHLKVRLVVRGRSAHSGSPHLGCNAIETAGAIVHALAGLRRDLESERAETSRWFPEVPHPVLTVARVRGGEAINVIPDRCVIDLGVRLLPGSATDPFVERLGRCVEDVEAGSASVEMVVENDNPPMLLAEDATVHRELCALVDQRESFGVSFASDAGVLQRDMGMECVLFGPGSIEIAHRANEYVPIDEMREARRVLERLTARACGA